MANDDRMITELLLSMLAQLREMLSVLDRIIDQYTDSSSRPNGEPLNVMLNKNYSFFKGKKPTAVLFPDGRKAEASTWKKCVREILIDSIADPTVSQTMLSLRGHIFGRNRLILSDSPERMSSPICFGDGLYFESKFDTETLLYVLVERVLTPCGYDSKGITIQVCLMP